MSHYDSCTIAYIDQETGKVHSIYCNRRGEPARAGVTLALFYNSYEKACELVSYGDASYIAPYICGTDDSFNGDMSCVFYHRDAEEQLIVRSYDTPEDIVRGTHGATTYLFQDGTWYYKEYLPKFVPLDREVCDVLDAHNGNVDNAFPFIRLLNSVDDYNACVRRIEDIARHYKMRNDVVFPKKEDIDAWFV